MNKWQGSRFKEVFGSGDVGVVDEQKVVAWFDREEGKGESNASSAQPRFTEPEPRMRVLRAPGCLKERGAGEGVAAVASRERRARDAPRFTQSHHNLAQPTGARRLFLPT